MAIQVEHEIHRRRRGRNAGVGLILVVLVGIVFGLTVVKVLNMGDITKMGLDNRMTPPAAQAPAGGAAP